MHRIKHFKLGLLIILSLELILFFIVQVRNIIFLLPMPGIYLLVCFLRWRCYQRKLLTLQLEGIDQLDGLDFEYFLYYLFKKNHIHTKITPYSHDFGADLILKYRRKKIVVQAKRWNENVGIKAVQETIGAMAYYKAKYGVVITNSFYTKSAIELANASNITLLNRYDLAELMQCNSNEIFRKLTDKKNSKQLPIRDDSDVCLYCGSSLVKRSGPYGTFLGCSSYPNCKYTKDISS